MKPNDGNRSPAQAAFIEYNPLPISMWDGKDKTGTIPNLCLFRMTTWGASTNILYDKIYKYIHMWVKQSRRWETDTTGSIRRTDVYILFLELYRPLSVNWGRDILCYYTK